MGRPLKPPSGHSRRGIPCQRRPRSGEKPSGVSAFVGVKGEDIRTLRAKRPEASAVCRKAAGMPGGAKTSSRYQVSGTGHRIRCSASGSQPSVWMKNARRSYLPCPSSLHGRGPNTEHRRPSLATGKRAHWVSMAMLCIAMHTPCAGFSKHEPSIQPGSRPSIQVSDPRSRVPGIGYQAPDSVFGLRFSALGLDKVQGKFTSPSSPHARRPNTEDRRPSPAPGKRAHRVCTLGVPHPGHRLLPYCLPAPHRFDPADGSGYDGGRSQPGPGSPYWGEKGKGCKSPAVPPP
jgi:hypothetical protein